ncbi:MAG: DNA mismatch repair protein MutS [Myxococcales bacterium]|nr:DNA mismatch repair protein MutS [Myxococcales bacterium]
MPAAGRLPQGCLRRTGRHLDGNVRHGSRQGRGDGGHDAGARHISPGRAAAHVRHHCTWHAGPRGRARRHGLAVGRAGRLPTRIGGRHGGRDPGPRVQLRRSAARRRRPHRQGLTADGRPPDAPPMDAPHYLTTEDADLERLTPVMRQVIDAKHKHPDALVLFRLGDFYELFFEDAVEGSRLLDLTLTSRNRNDPRPIPMCGFPWHQMGAYVQKLVEAGRRAAVVEQLEDAATAKGLVARGVTHLITPGVVLDAGALDDRRSHHLTALVPGRRDGLGIAVADVTTGQCGTALVMHRAALGVLLTRVEPREIVAPADAAPWLEGVGAAVGVPITVRAAPEGVDLVAQALGLLKAYLREVRPAAADLLAPPQPLDGIAHLQLAREAVLHLELLATARGGRRQGSLAHAVDRTVTAAGARQLRTLLLAPLADRRAIELRHAAVASLVADRPTRDAIRSHMRHHGDVARIATRALAGLSHPRELAALRDTLDTLPQLVRLTALLEEGVALAGIAADLGGTEPLCAVLHAALAETPRAAVADGGVIRLGHDAQLDELTGLAEYSQGWLASFEAAERERTGLPTLRVTYNRVTGYGIEVTRAKAERVPPHYHRKQTLKNVERYMTDELAGFERKMESAEARRLVRETELFRALVLRVAADAARLRTVAFALAELDVHAGFAEHAAETRCVQPRFVDAPILQLSAARHPVVEALAAPGSFVPNDVDLRGDPGEAPARAPPTLFERESERYERTPVDADGLLRSGDVPAAQILLLTGPNMAGKSTYMRAAALSVVLAQSGGFVPADAAVMGVCDAVLTRIGAGDDITEGASTFLVEMRETAAILERATPRTLVLLDEVGRGTSTWDGLAIAWAVVEALHDRRALVLFATHYHELTALEGRLGRLRNAHVAVREWGDEIVFVHRVQPGATSRSHGVAVGRLAGLPDAVVARARKLLDLFERSTQATLGEDGERRSRLRRQLGLFDAAPEDPASKRPAALDPAVGQWLADLASLDVDALTPRQALERLGADVERARALRDRHLPPGDRT